MFSPEKDTSKVTAAWMVEGRRLRSACQNLFVWRPCMEEGMS